VRDYVCVRVHVMPDALPHAVKKTIALRHSSMLARMDVFWAGERTASFQGSILMRWYAERSMAMVPTGASEMVEIGNGKSEGRRKQERRMKEGG
jgi:hypothetical protein